MKTFDDLAICVIGTYSSRNLGDQIMQKGCAIGLRHTFPKAKILILTPSIKTDSKIYEPVFDKVLKSHRKNPFRMLLSLIFSSFWHLGASSAIPLSNDLTEIRKSDLVIFTNGDMFTEDSGLLVGLTHIIPMLLALNSKKKYFLLGQSIGKFRRLTPIARKIINGAEGVYVRESDSLDYVLSVAPEVEGKLFRTGDLAFLAHSANLDWKKEPLAKKGAPIKIGVSLSNLFTNHIQSNQGIGRALAFELLVESLKEVKWSLGAEFVYVPHVRAKGERDDLPLSRRLQVELGGEIKKVSSSEEAARVFHECSLTIASRMHANIASLSVGTPTIALSYSHKSEGMMTNFGLRHLVLAAQDFSVPRLTELCERALEGGSKAREKIMAQAEREANLAERYILDMSRSLP